MKYSVNQINEIAKLSDRPKCNKCGETDDWVDNRNGTDQCLNCNNIQNS